VDGAYPFNPIEFFQNSILKDQIFQHPLTYLTYLRELIFSHHYLHNSSLKWREIRTKVKPNEIVYGGPLGVDYHYRGSEFGVIAMKYRFQYAYKLGYRFLFGHAPNPISGILDKKLNKDLSLDHIRFKCLKQ